MPVTMAWILIFIIVGVLVLTVVVMQRGRRRDAIDGLRADLRRRLELEYDVRRRAHAISMPRSAYVDAEIDRLVHTVERQARRWAVTTAALVAVLLPPLLTLLALQLGSTASPVWGFLMVAPLGVAVAVLVHRWIGRDAGVRASLLESRIRQRLGKS